MDYREALINDLKNIFSDYKFEITEEEIRIKNFKIENLDIIITSKFTIHYKKVTALDITALHAYFQGYITTKNYPLLQKEGAIYHNLGYSHIYLNKIGPYRYNSFEKRMYVVRLIKDVENLLKDF